MSQTLLTNWKSKGQKWSLPNRIKPSKTLFSPASFLNRSSLLQDILLPQRLIGPVLHREEDGAGFEGAEGVPMTGGDVDRGAGASGRQLDRIAELAGFVVILLHETPAQADDRLPTSCGGGGPASRCPVRWRSASAATHPPENPGDPDASADAAKLSPSRSSYQGLPG